MTFWIGSDAPGGVHVLIVGVGTYQGRSLEELPGAAFSASKLADWWVRSSDRILDGQHLGSIDILISSETTPYLITPDGDYAQAQAATQANVLEAFEQWRERSVHASLAVLHWIGHGEKVGVAGATHALFCNDLDRKGRLNGIDWTRTATAIHDSLEDRAICFIDACRSVTASDESFPSFESALKLDVTACPTHSAVLYSSDDGGKSHCLPGREDPGARRGVFRGGAIFSQALLWALDGYAATDRGPKPGAHVHEDDIVRVLRDRVALWRDMHRELDGLDFQPQPATAARWFGRKVVKAPSPMSSVRCWVENEDVGPKDADFDVEPAGMASPVTPVNFKWHVDMPHGADWIAKAECPETRETGARSFVRRFNTVHPIQEIEMVEVAGS